MNNTRRPEFAQGSIRYAGFPVNYKATIMPTIHAPHVGADSPRFMEPGREVAYFELFDDDGDEYQHLFMDKEMEEMRVLILEDWQLRKVAESLMAAGVVA
jgi:hypothetical protein